jgi:hypothetical protein
MPDPLVGRIAVIGDHQPGNPTHAAIDSAVAHEDEAVGTSTAVTWVATDGATLDAPAEALPQTPSGPTAPHPIVAAFVTATARRGERTTADPTRASVRVGAERRPT